MSVPRRPIPSRMANYHEPILRPSDTDVMSDYRHPLSRPTIPGRMANYSGHEDGDATSAIACRRSPSPMERDSPRHETSRDSMLSRLSLSSTRDFSDEGIELQALHFKEPTKVQLSEYSTHISLEEQTDHPINNDRRSRMKETLRTMSMSYRKRIRLSRFHGWRMGVLLGSIASASVLVCNIALIYIGHHRSGYNRDGIATLFEGDEKAVATFNTGTHVLINALSTVLLSMSNYTMQVLNSPTRHDIDKAHARGKWYDIGLLSIHNMRIIPRKRATLCFLLAISSTPLHLFYNASIFKIIRLYAYEVNIYPSGNLIFRNLTNNDTFVSLQASEWRRLYEEKYISRYGNLYLGIDSIAFDTSYNATASKFSIANFLPRILSSSEFADFVPASAEGWAPSEWLSIPQNTKTPDMIHVKEGYATNSGRDSRIQINLYFMIVILICNLFKLIIMVYTLVSHRSDPLVTLGDAAASFLEHPEPLTEGKCTLNTQELFVSYEESPKCDDGADTEVDDSVYPNGAWQPRVRKYCSSVGFDKAWSATISVACLALVLVILPTRANNIDHTIWKWGATSGGLLSIGSHDATTKGTTWNAWLSNMPQVLLSMCYLNLNTICTSMACSKEWNTLATSRKGLRVTRSFGEQRSTYFLQLPYKWALPLITLSGFLHWLLSQAFFFARIDYYDQNGKIDNWTSGCGVSLSSLFTFFFVALIMVCALLMLARWPMFTRLPLAESCSLMISAACHPAPDEVDPHLAKVQWGVVSDMKVNGHGHCSLSSKSVTKPVVGEVYY